MTSRILPFLAGCTLALLTGQAAFADQGPKVRAGGWELTIKVEGTTMAPMIRRVCRSKDLTMDDFIRTAQTQQPGGSCTISDIKATSSSMTYTQLCTYGQVKMLMHGDARSTGPDSFINTVKGHMDMGSGGSRDTVTVINSRRTGECQPGDMQQP